MALYKGEDKIKDIYLGDVPIFKVYAGEEFCGFFTFSHENLVENSHLLIDSNSDNIPDGFSYNTATDISLTNGIAKFTATAQYGGLASPFALTNGIKYYVFGNIKTSVPNVVGLNTPSPTRHSGSGNFEFISNVFTATDGRTLSVLDIRTSDFTSIEVDYIGAINITDLVSRDILPSGLTDAQYKDILDDYFNS